MGRQDLADVLDGEMLRRTLPTAAVTALVAWLNGAGARYAAGTGGHAVEYVPAHWSAVEPWPARFAERHCAQICTVSREQVVAAIREALAREDWAEVLVASYVWGQGRTGYGPYRLKEILGEPGVGDVLAQASHALREEGAVGAYRVLNGAAQGLGPAFFTKYLYFLDAGMDGQRAPQALILDQRVARILRAYATRVGLDMGLQSALSVAAWTWSDGGWTPHRYGVYVQWMTTATGQLASTGSGWPSGCVELLELAFFSGAWDPSADGPIEGLSDT